MTSSLTAFDCNQLLARQDEDATAYRQRLEVPMDGMGIKEKPLLLAAKMIACAWEKLEMEQSPFLTEAAESPHTQRENMQVAVALFAGELKTNLRNLQSIESQYEDLDFADKPDREKRISFKATKRNFVGTFDAATGRATGALNAVRNAIEEIMPDEEAEIDNDGTLSPEFVEEFGGLNAEFKMARRNYLNIAKGGSPNKGRKGRKR